MQQSNFSVVGSAALLDRAVDLRSACKSGTSREYNVSSELFAFAHE